MRCVCFNYNGYNYRLLLVIRSINYNKYFIKCFNNLMILSINNEEVDDNNNNIIIIIV